MFLLLCTFFIVLGLVVLISGSKEGVHLTINGIHNEVLDIFFKLFTYMGDGAVTAIAVLPIGLLLWTKHKYSPLIIGWGTLLFCGVLAQFMKRVVFPDASRPLKFFGEGILHLVSGVDQHMAHSFPSGHTTTAFGFFAFLAIFFAKDKPFLQGFFAVCAVLIGYSRMYLSQHFLEDVVTGAVLGLIAFLIMLIIKSKMKINQTSGEMSSK